MQLSLLTCLLGLTSFALADYDMYCNRGTAGDGRCEAEGFYTFCVRPLLPPQQISLECAFQVLC